MPKKDSKVAQGSKNRPREPVKAPQTPLLENLSKKLVERARAGTVYDPVRKQKADEQETSKRDNKKSLRSPVRL